MTVDIQVHGAGSGSSVFLFEPLTDTGRDWMEENVGAESWQWLGGRLAVDAHFAFGLAAGMVEEGLIVR